MATNIVLKNKIGTPVTFEDVTKVVLKDDDAQDVEFVSPTGKLTITATAEVDCTNYAAAQVVDANLIAENIKKDVTILGVTGTYEA